MAIVTLPEFIPHRGQKKILAEHKGRTVACMGRRFGKTHLMIDIILNQRGGALVGADGSGRYGLPTAWYAPSDSYFTMVFQEIVRMYGPLIARCPTQPRPFIQFVNGGQIDFWTLESPMKCGRGRFYARVVIDEAAHARHLQTAWEKTIEFTLADLEGDAFFISTPNGLNYFYDLYNRHGKDEWVSHTAPSYENPYLPPGWMGRKRKEMPELVYAQEVLAQFVTFGAGMIKPQFIQEGTPPPGNRVVLGVDLAISERNTADWTAIVALSKDKATGKIYIHEVERFRAGFATVLERIKSAAARHDPLVIGIESYQYQTAVVQELARTTHLPVRGIRPDSDKVTRFQGMLTKYEQGQVYHAPGGIPGWFREDLLAFPEGKHDDSVDACAIAYIALNLVSRTYGAVKKETV